MFVIVLTYKKPLEIVDQYVIPHRAYLDECYKNNCLITSGPQKPRTGGIFISQLNDCSAVEELIKQDPFYTHGIADYQVIEFDPIKYKAEFKQFVG